MGGAGVVLTSSSTALLRALNLVVYSVSHRCSKACCIACLRHHSFSTCHMPGNSCPCSRECSGEMERSSERLMNLQKDTQQVLLFSPAMLPCLSWLEGTFLL